MENRTTKIKEEFVEVTLSYASRARFNKLGYDFPLNLISSKIKVKVAVKDLQPKSNVKITRICSGCKKEDFLVYGKACRAPMCHQCVCTTLEFSKNVGRATQKARMLRGSKVSARRKYLLEVGDLPEDYCVHHVNMDASDNRLENLIALSRSQHHVTHGTFNRLCKELMAAGLVILNKDTVSYELSNEFSKLNLGFL